MLILAKETLVFFDKIKAGELTLNFGGVSFESPSYFFFIFGLLAANADHKPCIRHKRKSCSLGKGVFLSSKEKPLPKTPYQKPDVF